MSVFTSEPVQLVNLAPLVPLVIAPGATAFTFGPYNLKGFLNGRLRGNAHSDVAGTLVVTFSPNSLAGGLGWSVPQDVSQPGFQYPFDIIILQPFARIFFVNGLAPTTFFRANIQALPV